MVDEQVRYDVEIQAVQALQELRKLIEGIEGADNKVMVFSKKLAQLSKAWNVPFRDLISKFKELDRAFSVSSGQSPIFNTQQWQNVTRFIESAAAGGAKFAKNIDGAAEKQEKFARATGKSSEATRTFTQRLLSMENVLRTAFGTLLAVAIFNLLQFAQNTVRKAIESIRDLEIAFYNLGNAERTMSEAGIEITLKELEEVIERISLKFKGMFSKVELQDAVADIAIAVKDLGFGAVQIEKMLQAIAVVKLRNPDKSLKEVTGSTITALLSGRTQALQAMGIAANEATVQEKALEMGLIKSGEAMTTQIKALAILEIMFDATKNEAENLGDSQSKLFMVTQQASTAWTDFLTEMGKLAAPFIIEGLKLFTDQLIKINEWLVKNEETLSAFVASFAGLMRGLSVANKMSFLELTIRGGWQEVIQQIHDGMQEAKKIADEFGEGTETPTASIDALNNIDLTQASEQIDDLISDLDRLDKKAADVEQDFKLKMERMGEDHLRDMRDMRLDYERDVEDTLRDFNRKRADLDQKYRNNEIDNEAKFQEQLRQLREKFLFSLEDALRERDARQVLRLISQYQMDRQAAINEHNLARADRQRRHAEEMQDIAQQREDKLRELEEEYEIKRQRAEEDYQIKHDRARQDHEQTMAEIRQEIEERLQEFARAIGEEYGLKEDGVNAIYDLLNKYYGPGGMIDGLYAYSNASMIANAQAMLAAVQQIVGQYLGMLGSQPIPMDLSGIQTTGRSAGNLGGSTGKKSAGKQAQGGTYLATQPTEAVFGEAGPEIASFIPVSRLGPSNPLASLMGGGDMGGKLEIALLLSPDLEARITSNTLDKAGSIVTKIIRSKG